MSSTASASRVLGAPTVTSSYHISYPETPLALEYMYAFTYSPTCVCARARVRACHQMPLTASTWLASGARTLWQSVSRYTSASG